MPVHVIQRNGKYRLVEKDGQIAKGSRGNARDGGGHNSRVKAEKQARAINQGLHHR